MPVTPTTTPLPAQTPPAYRQDVHASGAANMTQPYQQVTPLRYLGRGQPQPEVRVAVVPVKKPSPMVPATVNLPRIQLIPAPARPAVSASAPAAPVVHPASKPSGDASESVPVIVQEHRLHARPGASDADVSKVVARLGGEGTAPVEIVYFPIGAAIVPDADIARLRRLDAGRCYLSIGFSDPTGPVNMVQGLSAARAAAAATVMGTAHLRVHSVGFGALGVSHLPADYAKDRRAEIWAAHCPPPVAAPVRPGKGMQVVAVEIHVHRLASGRWETTVSRDFATQGAAQNWADQVRHWPEIEAIAHQMKQAARVAAQRLDTAAGDTWTGLKAIGSKISGGGAK